MNIGIIKGYKALRKIGLLNILSDEQFIKLSYRVLLGKKLDIEKPQKFSEKIQWLKLYDRKPLYPQIVDKFEAKKYVASIIGKQYIIPTLGVWDKFESIDFDSLPNQFVIKCTHDSGSFVICRDKKDFDIKLTKKKIEKCMKSNYYWRGREWPYKNVKKRIIAEKYMEDELSELKDYKFFCFNGKPCFCQVISDRHSNETIDFYDMDWIHQKFNGLSIPQKPFPSSQTEILCPVNFEKMKEFAAILSRDIPFLRVDFYEINGSLYFGELTFYPASGFGSFSPEKWDYILGKMIKLPKRNHVMHKYR